MRWTIIGLITVLVGLIAVVGLMPPQTVYAKVCDKSDAGFILPKWYKYMDVSVDSSGECNLGPSFPNNLPRLTLAIVEILLRVAGILAVIYVVYGGFQYMMSTGEPEKVRGARTTILNALIGLVIAVMSTVIVNLVGKNIAP